MTKQVKKIAVTGAAGQIAYSLIFRIAQGDLLGGDQPVALHLLDVPEMAKALEGVAMELQDCALPLLKEVHVESDPNQIFQDVQYALLVGAKPRGPGMERKDLLGDNGKIFVEQGRALNRAAARDVRVLVVGNPCNTNCLIAMHYAPDLPKSQFFSMTRLDQNRAAAQLAMRAGVGVAEVSRMVVWGNHSSTQVPDFLNAHIRGRPATQMISDRKWLEGEFVQKVQKRGAEVIAARGKSSAASAAHAIIGSMRSVCAPTAPGDWFSLSVSSDKNPYGIPPGLVFSFPCRSQGKGDWEIVPNLTIDPFLKEKIQLTQKELMEERELISHLLRGI